MNLIDIHILLVLEPAVQSAVQAATTVAREVQREERHLVLPPHGWLQSSNGVPSSNKAANPLIRESSRRSLGCLTYELCALRPPFEAASQSNLSILCLKLFSRYEEINEIQLFLHLKFFTLKSI